MKKADRDRFYCLVDEMKDLIDRNNLISKKDIICIVNELVTLKFRLQDKNKYFR